MQVILLAAGSSSRMKPLSDKALLQICGKAVIEHQIDLILSAGINDFVVVCNEGNLEKIKEICKGKKGNFDFVIQENQNDGMKGAILACEKIAKEKVFVVSSNDIVEKEIFEKMLSESEKNKHFGLICGKLVKSYFPGGYVSLDKNGFLEKIVEKPGEGNEPSDKINLVLHIWNNFGEFVEKMKNFHNSTDDAYEKTIDFFVCEKGEKIKVVDYQGFWQAIKYPWHLFSLTEFFLKNQKTKISDQAQVSKKAMLRGDGIIVGKGVKIFENSVIVGPAYIGEGTVIGNGSLIRKASIGKNCVIGFNSEVARSLIQERVWTHSNYIGDSVVDSNVSFGSGTVTGNLRLDEEEISVEIKGQKIKTGLNKIGAFIGKNCRFGINCSLNPGIKIGENSMTTSGLIICENVEKNSFISVKTKLVIKPNKKEIKERN